MDKTQGQFSALPNLNLIFINGKPCSGKDELAKKLAQENEGWVAFSVGNRLKQAGHVSEDPFFDLVSPYIQNVEYGINVPGNVLINLENPEDSLIPAYINEQIALGTNTIIFTGYPRDMDQLEPLEEYLDNVLISQAILDEHHLYLDISDETSLKRVAARLKEYKDSGRTTRDDDEPEVARYRLEETFKKGVLPMVDYLREHRELKDISGEGTMEANYLEALRVLGEGTILNPEGILIPRGSKERE